MRFTLSKGIPSPDADQIGRTSHGVRNTYAREWWLWTLAVVVTLVLTLGVVSLTLPGSQPGSDFGWFDLRQAVRGLAGVVLLFDIYTLYQQLQIHRIRRELETRNELFRVISENAADMIALVDAGGQRLYNSPAYEKVLGYSAEDLQKTSAFDQIHPDDRQRVLEAAEKTRLTGHGERLEYRIRHKNGSWRILESIATTINSSKGQTEKLVIVNRDITDRKRAEERLAHSGFHDALTDLPNRALFINRLEHALALAKKREGYEFAVLFIDIDEFKVVNDSLGYSRGDELLVEIGQRLTKSLRRDDMISRTASAKMGREPEPEEQTLARLGGDEFTVLLDGVRSPTDALRVADRLQTALARPFLIPEHELALTASIGVAMSTRQYQAPEDLLRDANIAMYRAKRSGKGKCEVFDREMHASAVQRLKLETDLRKAIERTEFRNYYQPIVSLADGRIVGFEALVRWIRSDGSIVSPGQFIVVADECGLIWPMNRLLLQQACQQVRSWQSQFNSPVWLSMNVSAKEMAHPDLATAIELTLRETDLQPSSLHLEIMETVAMSDVKRTDEVLSRLKGLGVTLSIDDFGTGYSSLSRLQNFPVDTLKIDRSFVSKMDCDRETEAIVRAIVVLAHTLGLEVVAEGAETKAQVDALKQLGCELAQGYFFSKPVDESAMELFLSHSQLN